MEGRSIDWFQTCWIACYCQLRKPLILCCRNMREYPSQRSCNTFLSPLCIPFPMDIIPEKLLGRWSFQEKSWVCILIWETLEEESRMTCRLGEEWGEENLKVIPASGGSVMNWKLAATMQSGQQSWYGGKEMVLHWETNQERRFLLKCLSTNKCDLSQHFSYA